MAERKVKLVPGEYYHIFNRGTNKIDIFRDKGDMYYFFDAMHISKKVESTEDRYSKKRKELKEKSKKEKQLVSVVAYCLLPNHFHFILRENVEGGISKFMSKLGSSYVKYFNNKYDRSGSLFQGRFKAVPLDKEHSLEYVSVYVNLNYKHHQINPKKLLVKTSLYEFLGTEKGEVICESKEIENILKTSEGLENYKKILKEKSKGFVKQKGHDPNNIYFNEWE